MIDTKLLIDAIRIFKANDEDVAKERAVRLFKSSPDGWDLQVRGPMGVGFNGHKDGKDFVVAGATCTRDDLLALRHAIDKALDIGANSESHSGAGGTYPTAPHDEPETGSTRAPDMQILRSALTSVRALRARLLDAQEKAEAEQDAALNSRPRKRGDADRRHTISGSRAGVAAAFAICISALDEILAPLDAYDAALMDGKEEVPK